MARYIDAEALCKRLSFMVERYNALGQVRVAQDYNWAVTLLDSAPTENVVPVVHGRCTACGWEEPDSCGYDGYEIEPWRHTPLCHNCGARMDGEE